MLKNPKKYLYFLFIPLCVLAAYLIKAFSIFCMGNFDYLFSDVKPVMAGVYMWFSMLGVFNVLTLNLRSFKSRIRIFLSFLGVFSGFVICDLAILLIIDNPDFDIYNILGTEAVLVKTFLVFFFIYFYCFCVVWTRFMAQPGTLVVLNGKFIYPDKGVLSRYTIYPFLFYANNYLILEEKMDFTELELKRVEFKDGVYDIKANASIFIDIERTFSTRCEIFPFKNLKEFREKCVGFLSDAIRNKAKKLAFSELILENDENQKDWQEDLDLCHGHFTSNKIVVERRGNFSINGISVFWDNDAEYIFG